MVREDREKEAARRAEQAKELKFDGMSVWEMRATTARLLREDRKRPTRRMAWRLPNV